MNLTSSETPKTGFLVKRPIYYNCKGIMWELRFISKHTLCIQSTKAQGVAKDVIIFMCVIGVLPHPRMGGGGVIPIHTAA